MKRTALLRCLVIVLSLGIVAMSLIGCEGPAGPAGTAGPAGPAGPAGTTGIVPLFMQGTWKTSGLPTALWTFTEDRASFITTPATLNYEVIFLLFYFDENGDEDTKDIYPGGYTMDGMQVNGDLLAPVNNNEYIGAYFAFNSTLDAFVYFNNGGVNNGVFYKQ